MKTDDEIAVRDAIARLTGALAPNPAELVESATLLVDNLGYDSLRLVELSLWLEEIFETEASAMDEAQGIKTVGDLQEFIIGMISEGRAAIPAEATLVQAINNS
jgi:acyl carrier protein